MENTGAGYEIGRRHLLGLGGVSTAAILLGTGLYPTPVHADPALPKQNPFTLGVASGDPLPTSVVLWTRLAPDPLAGDGAGGMPPEPVTVRYEVAEDERFRRVVRTGRAEASPELAHSVHVDARGLRPGREYYYRFRAGGEISPVGRTRTAPEAAATLASMRFAFASCQHFEEGYFSAYRHLVADDPDLVAHCGDYIYESPSGLEVQPRKHILEEPYDLREYRLRHSQYKTDADLREAHRLLPWIFTYDDHDVDNNWAASVASDGMPPEEFLRRRAAAFQAYYEHLPLRPERRPQGPDIPLYRRLRYADLVTFNVLDGRQYRDPQPECADPEDCPPPQDPERTMLGTEQERWLLDGLRSSETTWNVLVQQVPFTQLDEKEGPGFTFGLDNWNYFPAARARIVDEFVRRPDLNPIIIGGEIHRHLAADVKADYDATASPVAAEFVASSIASGGDGDADSDWVRLILAENEHIPYAHERRGYVRCQVDRDSWHADFRVVPIVTDPDSGAETDATYVVEAGQPGIQLA